MLWSNNKSNTKPYEHNYELLSNAAYQWFTSEKGKVFRQAEDALLAQYFENFHTKNICSVGFSEIRSKVFSSLGKEFLSLGTLQKLPSTIFSDIHYWPIHSCSMDAILIHHALEWTKHPQRVLREASRSLCPGGQLMIVCFNFFSINAFFRYYLRYYPKVFYLSKFYSSAKIKKWLHILGFANIKTKFSLYLAPVHYPSQRHSKVKKIYNTSIPGGSVFIITAEKEKAGFIFNKTMWKRYNASSLKPFHIRPVGFTKMKK